MDMLQIRENEVFESLKKMKGLKFVVIGGYAVNSYTLPRFSVDCDIVVEEGTESAKIDTILTELGYDKKESSKTGYLARFERYEKELRDSFKVSFDILIGEVLDRQTRVSFSAGWIFKNSDIKTLRGKTIIEKLDAKIINIDALFVMKLISCRSTDIRDLFMLAPNLKDMDFIRKEVSSRYDFNERIRKVKEKVTSKKFKDGLQGVYGLLNTEIFEKSVNAILELETKA